MTSLKKIEANRRNAAHSTGPTSAAGKATASQNALKHGLFSRQARLPGEKKETLEALREALRADLRPVGAVEDLLVEKIIAFSWRLRRLHKVEVGIFEDDEARLDDKGKDQGVGAAFLYDAINVDGFGKLARYEAHIERALYRALTELRHYQAARGGQPVPPPPPADGKAKGAGPGGAAARPERPARSNGA